MLSLRNFDQDFLLSSAHFKWWIIFMEQPCLCYLIMKSRNHFVEGLFLGAGVDRCAFDFILKFQQSFNVCIVLYP